MTTSACNPLFEFKFNVRKRNQLEKVKKSLFGPVDHEYNRKFIAEHLRFDQENMSSKYNFDFYNERPLDPKGDIVWEQASPLSINRKRKQQREIIDDSSLMYFQPIETHFKPIEPVASLPENKLKTNLTVPKQSLITDFMAKSKRSGIFVKDTSDERPKKIAKLNECSS